MRSKSFRLLVVSALLVAGTALIVCDAQAQGVRFLTPADGDTVRGLVMVKATKPMPSSGWVSYKIEKGTGGNFVAATVEPFEFGWDTHQRDENGSILYPDGQYTIAAAALDPQGKNVGEAAITVTVKNNTSAAERPESVRLRLNYERNQKARYQADGSWEIKPAADEEQPEDVLDVAEQANGAMVANWRNKVMSPTIAGGRAVLHVIVGSVGEQVGQEEKATGWPNAGKSHTYLAFPDGVMRLKHDDETEFDLAELYLKLPDRALRVGDTWTSDIRVLPVPQMHTEVRIVRAKHRVDGFEWMGGHKCARIHSQFKVDEETIKPRLQPRATQAPVFGGPVSPMEGMGMPPEMYEGMMPPEMYEDVMMAPEMYEDVMFPGMAGVPGMAGGMQGMSEYETSYVGERITYLAYELSRPVKIIDMITHSLELPRTGAAGAPTSLIPGEPMPGFDDVMMPGMYEEMMPPGMYEEMMPPGMYEEMMFPGMAGAPGMATVEPMKVEIHVKLEITEVGL